MHKRHAAVHEHDGKPADVVIVLKISNKDIGRLDLLRLCKLTGDKLRDLLGKIDEVALTKEEALKLTGKGAVLGERPALVITGSAGATQVRGDKGPHRPRVQVELALRHDVYCRLEIENMQDGVIDFHVTSNYPLIRIKGAPPYP